MSKTSSGNAKPKAGKPAKRTFDTAAHLAALIAKKAERGVRSTLGHNPILVILFLCGIAVSLFCLPLVGAAKIAMLYLYADNGKKSGRADGNVYMRNGRVRGFVVPALVQNTYTTLQRSLFSILSSGWNALTDSQRLTWINMDWLFKSDRFGRPVAVKGKEAYVSLAGNLADVGIFGITDAPINSGGTSATSTSGTVADQSSGTVTANSVVAAANQAQKIFATAVVSPGTYRPKKSKFRLIGTMAGGATLTAAAFTALYEAKYGTSWKTNADYIDSKIYFQLHAVNETTGASGAGEVTYSIIQA